MLFCVNKIQGIIRASFHFYSISSLDVNLLDGNGGTYLFLNPFKVDVINLRKGLWGMILSKHEIY